MAIVNNERYHYSAKPPVFDREKFDCWKDRIESFFLGYDVDLLDIVIDGYNYPLNVDDTKMGISDMNEKQRKYYKNNHKLITIVLNVISCTEYEKITNRDSTKSIFDSLRMNNEGN